MALKPESPMNKAEYLVSLCLLIALTVSTVVLGAVRGYHFTTTYSQYVNQSTAFVYAVVSSFHLWALAKYDEWDHWRLARETEDDEKHRASENNDDDSTGDSSSYRRRKRGSGTAGTNAEALLNGHEEEYSGGGGGPEERSAEGGIGGYVGPGALRVGLEGESEGEGREGAESTDVRTSFGRHSSVFENAAVTSPRGSSFGDEKPRCSMSERGSLTSPLGGAGKGSAAVPGDDFVLRKAPLYILVAIGWLNGTGNFCAMIGQPHTRGETQSLIMIAGIPAVLALSWIILGKRPNAAAGVGAVVIICASVVSALPSIMSPEDDDIDSYWYSITIYFAAQIFWSLEKVMEDYAFCQYPTGERNVVEMRIDVLRMFNTIVWVDFWVAFLYYPVQSFDAFGNVKLDELPQVLLNGLRCTGGMAPVGGYNDDDVDDDLYGDDEELQYPHCSWVNTLVFFAFCVIDYSNYVVGLYVIQRNGANLMAIAGAVSLPIAQIVFTLPIMGYFTETFQVTDAIALCLAVTGFGIYHYCGQKHGEVVERRSFLIRDLSDVDLRAGELKGSFAEVGNSMDTVGTNWNRASVPSSSATSAAGSSLAP